MKAHRFHLGLVITTLALASLAHAQTPLLDQLNREVRSVHNDLRASVIPVDVPLPAWVAQLFVEADNPLAKWDKELNPEVKQTLAREMHGRLNRVDATIVPSTRPVEKPAEPSQSAAPARPTVRMLGVVLNGQGDVLVPMFVEKEIAEQYPIRTVVGTQQVTGKLLGADRPMNFSVFRMETPALKQAAISAGRPAEGELVLNLNIEGVASELQVWNGGRLDHGTIVHLNGQVSGFCRSGQFMSVATALPIAEQIINTGTVRRAFLGVRIDEVHKDDPIRHDNIQLGDRPAVRVDLVLPNSAAEKAGIKPNDLILSLAGEPVGELATFASKLASRSGKTSLHVLRGFEEMMVDVELVPK